MNGAFLRAAMGEVQEAGEGEGVYPCLLAPC